MTAGHCRFWCPPRCLLHIARRVFRPRARRFAAGEIIIRTRHMVIDGVNVDALVNLRDGLGKLTFEDPPALVLPKRLEITIHVQGNGLRDMLCPATVTRTRAGAWLVKGRGPTRRYSTKALACRVARARDRRYTATRGRL